MRARAARFGRLLDWRACQSDYRRGRNRAGHFPHGKKEFPVFCRSGRDCVPLGDLPEYSKSRRQKNAGGARGSGRGAFVFLHTRAAFSL